MLSSDRCPVENQNFEIRDWTTAYGWTAHTGGPGGGEEPALDNAGTIEQRIQEVVKRSMKKLDPGPARIAVFQMPSCKVWLPWPAAKFYSPADFLIGP